MDNMGSLEQGTSSTPSPAASTTATTTPVSRRPPRKSTLTQQQKNQKRQRATQDQLSLLEVEFNKSPTPTQQVREQIAQQINMTERSVQIWFQNRLVLQCSHLVDVSLTGEVAGGPRSSYLRRRVSSLVKTVMRFPNLIGTI